MKRGRGTPIEAADTGCHTVDGSSEPAPRDDSPRGRGDSIGLGVRLVRQIKSLLRDTWFMWCFFAAFSIFLAVTQSWIFYLALALLPFSMAYFAFMRYDDQGNYRADL